MKKTSSAVISPTANSTPAVANTTARPVEKIEKKKKTKNMFKLTKKISKIVAEIYYPVMFIFWLVLSLNLILPFQFKQWTWWAQWAPLIFMVSFSAVQFFRFVVFKSRIFLRNYNFNTRIYARTRNGAPGAGKTSSAAYDAVVMAKNMWREVCWEYWLICWRLNSLLKNSSKNQREEILQIVECYRFYNSKPHLFPCLITSIGIKVGNQFSLMLMRSNLAQLSRMLYRTVIFHDETGNEFGANVTRLKTGKKDEILSYEELARFLRHFGEFHLITTEHDKGNIVIGLRRVTDENMYLLWQKPVLKPPLITFYFDLHKRFISFLLTKFPNILKPFSIFFSHYNVFLDTFLKAIGFRKYKYQNFANTQSEIKSDEKKRSFILPSLLNCKYDDHCFRRKYKCHNQPLNLRSWKTVT